MWSPDSTYLAPTGLYALQISLYDSADEYKGYETLIFNLYELTDNEYHLELFPQDEPLYPT